MSKGLIIRLLIYLAFVLSRQALLWHTQVFPFSDGNDYFSKTAWMAAEPFWRALPWEAFGYIPERPPGPMWLMLPFMVVRPTFGAYVFGMSLWIVMLVEIALRQLIDRGREMLRAMAAGIILAGLASFYVTLELFYVDALFAAMHVALFGLAYAWLRKPGALRAFAIGLLLSYLLWIKPAALSNYGALPLALGAAVLARHFILRKPYAGMNARRWLLQSFCMVLPATLGVLSLFFTEYNQAWANFHPDKQVAWGEGMLVRRNIFQDFWTFESVLHVLRLLVKYAGFFFLAAGLGFVLFRIIKLSGKRQYILPGFLLVLIPIGIWFLMILMLPNREARYLAPLIAWGLAGLVALLGRPEPGDRWGIWAGLLIAVFILQRLAMLGFFPAIIFSDRSAFISESCMRTQRESLRKLDAAIEQMDRTPLVMQTDLTWEMEGIWLAESLRRAGAERALQNFAFNEECYLTGAQYPAFNTDQLVYFLKPDFILCRRPEPGFQMAPGSPSFDWDLLNRALFKMGDNPEMGLEEFNREDWGAVYRVHSENRDGLLPLAGRARFLFSLGLNSKAAKELLGRIEMLVDIVAIEPADREIAYELGAGNVRVLMHAEYPGNPLPWRMDLQTGGGRDMLTVQARPSTSGDGVLLRVGPADGDAVDFREYRLAPGALVHIPVNEAIRKTGEAENSLLRLEVLSGPSGNTADDCVEIFWSN